MLMLLLFIHTVFAKDTQQHHPTFRNVSSCPEVGYFLRSEPGEDLKRNQCYLCFCQDERAAVCWKHHNLRCDEKSYVHDKKIRPRRSPGFADLFFKDAARDMFQKQSLQECKPFQGSHSVGCPPADWCIGCTVCDCNANGRWDCHVLSFCPGDKRKKSKKKRRTVINEMKMKPPLRNATPPPKPTTKRTPAIKPTTKRTPPTKRTTKITMQTKRTVRKYITVQSKMKGTAPTKPTRKSTLIQSRVTTQPKPTTRRPTTKNQSKTKRTAITKPTNNKNVQMKSTVKRTTDTKEKKITNTTVKKITESKSLIKRTATKKPVKNTTVNRLSKVRQMNVKQQSANRTNIKTNKIMANNTKLRKDKANSSPPKKPVNSAKPVQKKTMTAKVKPGMRSFQKVTRKPMKNEINENKNKTLVVNMAKKISNDILKSTEKIINDKQKNVSKLIKTSDQGVQQKNKTIKNNFQTEPQRNVTIIETMNKIKDKVILNKRHKALKRLSRRKRYTNDVQSTNTK